ncbi:MAG: hypothetical protein AAF702_32575 [Chloroflexota bacterium]
MFLTEAQMTEIFTLSDAKKEMLHNTTISQEGPGTILTDFQTFLDFVAEGMPLSAKHYMPTKVLDALNQRMAIPYKHKLRRALQKSYPYLNGLYLLARSSGLTIVDGSGKKATLVFNEPIHDSWQKLNQTERYFTLLETWLLRSSPKIIGEDSRGVFSNPWYGLQLLFRQIPDEGLSAEAGASLADEFTYGPGLYSLASTDLFGLISLQSGEPPERLNIQIPSGRR